MEMNWLDHQHRGFTAYQEATAQCPDCQRLDRAIIAASDPSEKLDTVLLDCKVNLDWIEQIEAALPFVEKAVRQNRQFILRQGETVPLEKAKRVSRASVEHLSRHSELITTEPGPDEALRPDKIYITENIGTHAIYENRFLYMLLCYLRDFAGLRYRKITELAGAFSSDIAISKQLSHQNRTIEFRLTYHEAALGDQSGDEQANPAVRRIGSILQTVDQLLRTELMKEVSLAPMLKPPIARTNVLLHDPDFKVAFGLYTFLVGYTQDGYERLERYRHHGPFNQEMRADVATLVSMTSYLSYRCGGLRQELQDRASEENRRRKAEEARIYQERLAALKNRVGQIDGAALEYIAALEDSVHRMEEAALQWEDERARRMETEKALEEATERIASLRTTLAGSAEQLREKGEQISRLTGENTQLQETMQTQLRQAEARIEAERQQSAQALERQKQQALREYEALLEQYRLAKAMARDTRDIDEQCRTREGFAELEKEYEAFRRFYERQWKLTKKQIRKEQLWKK